jgi:C4-dicarboxylate-specific signal transduction histidine kinase
MFRKKFANRLFVQILIIGFFIFSAIEIIEIFGIPWFGINGTLKYQKHDLNEFINDLADEKVEEFYHIQRENIFFTQIIARRYSLNERLSSKSPADLMTIKRDFERVISSAPRIKHISIADIKAGKIILSTRQSSLALDIKGKSLYKKALFTDELFIESEKDESSQRIYICKGLNNETHLLIVELNMNHIWSIISSKSSILGKTGEELFFTDDGVILTKVKHPEGIKLGVTKIGALPAKLAASGNSGMVEALDYRGERVIAAYRYLALSADLGLGMVVKQDVEELYEPLREDLILSEIYTISATIILGIFIFFVIRRHLKPVIDLQVFAKRISGGDFTKRAKVKGEDEVSYLAKEFNRMTDEIENWKNSLEEMVESKTADLVEAMKQEKRLLDDLRERNKELKSLFLLSSLVSADSPLDDICDKVVKEILPSALQHPEIACVELVVEGERYCSSCDLCRKTETKGITLKAEIICHEEVVGNLIVCYLEDMPILDVGPFSNEENGLVKAVAERLGKVIEIYRLKEEVKSKTLTSQKVERLASVGAIAGGVTHEINQPLNVIKVTTDSILYSVMNKKIDLPEAVIYKLSRISDGVSKIDSIIKNMRKFWANPLGSETKEMDLNRVIEQAIISLDEQFKALDIVVSFTKSNDSILVRADATQMEQIIINLLNNARQSLAQCKGRERYVRIKTEILENEIYFEVEDNGVGLDGTDPEDLFDPFYSKGKGADGMGLGLAIVRDFVERAAGTISCEELAGHGVIFKGKFPSFRVRNER